MSGYQSKLMNPICEQAGCDPRMASKHAYKWETKRWHAHPSPAFVSWWEPAEFDTVSGAHMGGHPSARRQWARKESEGWRRQWYGVSTLDAWNTSEYVEEFAAWEQIGSPEPDEPFVSIAATKDRQKQFWKDLKPIVAQIGKSMPSTTPIDYDASSEMVDPDGMPVRDA